MGSKELYETVLHRLHTEALRDAHLVLVNMLVEKGVIDEDEYKDRVCAVLEVT